MEIKLWEIIAAMLPYWAGTLLVTSTGIYFVCNVNSIGKITAVLFAKYFLYNICMECFLGYYARGEAWFFALEFFGSFSIYLCIYIMKRMNAFSDGFVRFYCMSLLADCLSGFGTVVINVVADQFVTLPGRTSENCIGIHTLIVWLGFAGYALFIRQLGKGFLYKLRSYKLSHEKLCGIALMIFTPMGSVILWFGKYSWMSGGIVPAISGILVFLLLVGLMLELLFYQRMKNRHLRLENARLRIQKRILNGYSRSVWEQLNQISKLRHDIGNHIQTLEALEKEERECRAVAVYENRLKEQYHLLVQMKYNDNIIINAVICSKVNLCSRAGIRADIDVRTMKIGNVPELDMLSILFNLFDNAIEGCQRASDGTARFITLSGFNTVAGMFLKMKNSSGPVRLENGKIISSKKERELHGMGLQIVKDAVKKHGGSVEYKSEGNLFSVKVFLPVD